MKFSHAEIEQIEADGKRLGMIEAKSHILDAMIASCSTAHDVLGQTSSSRMASAAQLKTFLAVIAERFGIGTDHLAEAVNSLASRDTVPPLSHRGWNRLLADVQAAK